ncbi:hypothetical protein SISSUDRAFT_1053469 [Sistotremastrum suecicum HHB10207 ss-3]|uniref:Uncharacterized protein n=1 Tax=Sistotremastrum suecicum HHB10207 ss-3 TaxID=1314776 RepID=A0A165Z777_9AGAM|nr:hypothetical protein SISSUDRAFT_1053469 [Sistotremastrum suecicum HHB10207 ss-3]
MNHIARLEDEKIPRDAEFGFRSRATALVTTWQQIALHDSEQDRLPSGESTVPVVSTESETRVPAITADLLPDNAVSEPGIEDAEDWVVVDKS